MQILTEKCSDELLLYIEMYTPKGFPRCSMMFSFLVGHQGSFSIQRDPSEVTSLYLLASQLNWGRGEKGEDMRRYEKLKIPGNRNISTEI